MLLVDQAHHRRQRLAGGLLEASTLGGAADLDATVLRLLLQAQQVHGAAAEQQTAVLILGGGLQDEEGAALATELLRQPPVHGDPLADPGGFASSSRCPTWMPPVMR